MKMPVLFVGHGSPMNAIRRNACHVEWTAVARKIPKPGAVLCISAHWETDGAWVTATPTPEHYLRLLYAIALQQAHEKAGFFNVSVPASISKTSVLIGGDAAGG